MTRDAIEASNFDLKAVNPNAKSTEDSSGHGAGGYGMSYRRMLSGLKLFKWTLFQKYSLGATVQHDVVGRFGPAAEIDVAATVELVRHYIEKSRT